MARSSTAPALYSRKNVSLTTLDRVAEALDVAFSDLIQAPDARDPSRINEVAWAVRKQPATRLSQRLADGGAVCAKCGDLIRHYRLSEFPSYLLFLTVDTYWSDP